MNKKLIVIFSVCLLITVGIITSNFFLSNSNSKQKTVIVNNGLIAYKTQSELIKDADIIIVGSVQEKLPSKWSNPSFIKGKNIRNILTTDIKISIDDVLKGIPYNNKNIAVRLEKGETDDTIIKSDGYPDFIPEEKVLLFLSKDDSDIANKNENYYVLTGMNQGKYNFDENLSKFINSNNKKEFDLNTLKSQIEKN